MDLRQTREYGEYLQKSGWIVERSGKESVQILIRKMPLLPISVMKVQRWQGKLDWGELEKIKKRDRVIYQVLEPEVENGEREEMERRGFRLSKSPYLPTKTVVVDLGKGEDLLWRELSKDARQKIKQGEGLVIEETDDWEKFRGEWKKWGRGYVPGVESVVNLKRILGDKCRILVARKKAGGEMLSGAVIVEGGETAYYYFAWTGDEGRELNSQYKLVWEVIRGAKKRGNERFDFEGIYDERFPNKRWLGFSGFKKKFGGEEVIYPGSWQKWF